MTLDAVRDRFRGYLPVVVDVETGGFEAQQHALLEFAAVLVHPDAEGIWQRGESIQAHLKPEPGLLLDPAALKFNGINPHHPLRPAEPEAEALRRCFTWIKAAQKASGCKRVILVGHNAHFDLGFINAAVARHGLKNQNPFHPFSTFDTVTLAGLMTGQTVLAKACEVSDIPYSGSEAHSALYDAKVTADLFCHLLNRWERLQPSAATPAAQ